MEKREYCALIQENNEDDFIKLLKEIHYSNGFKFPNTAVHEIPMILSNEAKKRILSSGKSTEELSEILISAIEMINSGSIKRLEELILERLI